MKKKILTALFGIISAVALSATAFAFEESYVEVANNVGKKDVVTVNGMESKSVVSVFAENGMLLGKKTVGNRSTFVNINVTLPSADGGKITVSVSGKDATSPKTVLVVYPAEPVSDTPTNAAIVNNVDKKDTITVEGLEYRDTVTVYAAQTGGKKLVSSKVKKNSDEIILSHKQLGTDGGSVWISVTRTGKHESPRVEFTFAAEKVSTKITDTDSITITNNVGKKGIIEVSGLEAGEAIVIYSAESGGKKLGSAKCGKNKTEIKINNVQLTKEAGTIWMTIKRANELESKRFDIDYSAQEITPNPTKENNVKLEITNNPAGTSDTLYFDGLEAGDTIKVYANDTTSTVYLKGTVASGKTDVTLTKAQFGVDGTTLCITNTRKNMLESGRETITVPEEDKSDKLVPTNITIINNAGIASTIFVTGLDEGTTITAYDKETSGKTLGSAKVAAGSTNVTISVGSLNVGTGSVWVTRKDTGLAESIRVEKKYDAKKQSEWDENLVAEIEYNVGIASTITVSGLDEGDVVKAYSSKTTSTTLGQATRGANERSVTISTYSLKSGGEFYLSITKKGQIESEREKFECPEEDKSEDIDGDKVTIENNANSDAVITIYGLKKGDLVTVYQDSSGSKTYCKGTADTNYITLYTSSLNKVGGNVYITRQSSGLAESEREAVSYGAQLSSNTVSSSSVTIENNAGTADTITVSGLSASDVVKVYDSAYSTTPIVSGTVYNGSTEIKLNITQLGTGKGSVYITITSNGSSESLRTAVSYDAEEESTRPANVSFGTRTSMTVEVTISGLQAGDIIRLYADASGTSSYGSATSGGDSVTMTFSVPGTSAGFVYISRTSSGKHESMRSSYQYGAYVSTSSN